MASRPPQELQALDPNILQVDDDDDDDDDDNTDTMESKPRSPRHLPPGSTQMTLGPIQHDPEAKRATMELDQFTNELIRQASLQHQRRMSAHRDALSSSMKNKLSADLTRKPLADSSDTEAMNSVMTTPADAHVNPNGEIEMDTLPSTAYDEVNTDTTLDANADDTPTSRAALLSTKRQRLAVPGTSSDTSKPAGGTGWEKLRNRVHIMNALATGKNNAKLYGSTAPARTDVDDTSSTPVVIGESCCCVIMPDHPFIQGWEVVQLVLLVYVMLVLPWRMAFVDQAYDWLDILVDSLFLCDIIICFFSAYEDKNGHIVVSQWMIAKRYLMSWFILDVIATFPFYFVDDSSSSRATSLARLPRLLKVFRILRLLKLLRVAHVQQFFSRIQDSSHFHPGLFRLLNLSAWVIGIGHIAACMWVFIPQVNGSFGDGWMSTFAHADDLSLYNAALYYTFSTLTSTGFGDIHATTDEERVFSTVLVLAGVGFLSFFTATLTSVFRAWDLKSAEAKTRLERLRAFLHSIKLDHAMREKLIKHFTYVWSQPPAIANANEIIRETPRHLLAPLLYAMNRDLIQKVPFLSSHAGEDFVTELLPHLAPVKLVEGEVIAKYGRPVNMYYIIEQGTVEARHHATGATLLTFRDGGTFGEVGLLLTGVWGADMVCTTKCTLMTVPKRIFVSLMNEHIMTKKIVKDIAIERERRLLRPGNSGSIPDVAAYEKYRKSFMDMNTPTSAVARHHTLLKSDQSTLRVPQQDYSQSSKPRQNESKGASGADDDSDEDAPHARTRSVTVTSANVKGPKKIKQAKSLSTTPSLAAYTSGTPLVHTVTVDEMASDDRRSSSDAVGDAQSGVSSSQMANMMYRLGAVEAMVQQVLRNQTAILMMQKNVAGMPLDLDVTGAEDWHHPPSWRQHQDISSTPDPSGEFKQESTSPRPPVTEKPTQRPPRRK